jgi:hypothetical protein
MTTEAFDSFDPYYEWLGIPPHEQPANYYRLLGIPLFEPNPRVIENIYEQKMTFLRTKQIGKHVKLATQLQQELTVAQRVLLTPESRAAYDATLHASQAAPPAVLPVPIVVVPPPVVVPMSNTVEETPTVPLPISTASKGRSYKARGKKQVSAMLQLASVVIGGLLAIPCAIGLFAMLGWDPFGLIRPPKSIAATHTPEPLASQKLGTSSANPADLNTLEEPPPAGTNQTKASGAGKGKSHPKAKRDEPDSLADTGSAAGELQSTTVKLGGPPYALQFDGKAAVRFPTLRYAGDHPLTVEAWIVVTNEQGTGTILSDMEAGGFAMACNGIWVWIRDYRFAKTTVPMPRNQLVHVASVIEPKQQITFFLAGQPKASTEIANDITRSQMPLMLGGNPSPGEQIKSPFHGQIVAVRVSGVARYEQTFAPEWPFQKDAHTLALYQFEEGKGTELKDASGNNHHGMIEAAKWVSLQDLNIPLTPQTIASGNKPPMNPASPDTSRQLWSYENGQFERQDDGSWLQTVEGASYRYKEKNITKLCVELEQVDGKGTIFLYSAKATVLRPNSAKPEFFKMGSWQDSAQDKVFAALSEIDHRRLETALKTHFRQLHEADEKMSKAFDTTLEKIRKETKIPAEEQIKLINRITEEKAAFDKAGYLPFSVPMRMQWDEYIEMIALANKKLYEAFERHISAAVKESKTELAEQLVQERDRQINVVRLIARWGSGSEWQMFSDGTLTHPHWGQHHWKIKNNQISFDGNTWTLSPLGDSFKGVNQHKIHYGGTWLPPP